MSAVFAPFGLRPAYNPIGLDRAKKYTIASAYNTTIFKGDPVILGASGTINRAGANLDLIGVFAGCEYTDAGTGKRVVSDFWPAGQAVLAGSDTVAWVYDDPNNVYDIQANGSITQAALGDQADVVMGSGSTLTGISTVALSSALASTGAQAQLRIVGFNGDLSNAVGDAFTVVQVQIARHQYIANKVAL